MTFEERVEALVGAWGEDLVAVVGTCPMNEGVAVAVFATAEIFRRLTCGNAVERWGDIEKEIIRQFSEALHKGIEATRTPFN